MRNGFHDTIFACATGVGRAALAVLRVSGPESARVLEALCRAMPEPRRASLRRLRGADGSVLDEALVLWFPGPASFTGEDSFELHLHGGSAVQEGVMSALAALGGRPAEPGEFSRRAVSHGRMGLLEAEAMADLIDAETTLQRDQALRQMGGALTALYQGWSSRLLRFLAQQEAMIDFPDEDLPPEVDAAMLMEIAALTRECAAHLAEGVRGERLRSGLVFAIAGSPNAGKSTLINALCRRDIAIVSPVAGTTRDVLEARIEIAGVPVTLLDMAGLRDSDDALEAEGIRRARKRLAEADLIIALHPPGEATSPALPVTTAPVLQLHTKSDLGLPPGIAAMAVSAWTGDGMSDLFTALEKQVRLLVGSGATPVFTRARHRIALQEAVTHLSAGLDESLPELRGETLRLALQALSRITGAVGVEEVLDSVFHQFCIGK
jgi:tRNA modification GTPase